MVAKAEHLSKGGDVRFVVTSLDAAYLPAQPLYEQLYCGRGEIGESHQRTVFLI